MASTTSPPNPIDALWPGYPGTPRGVAALINLMEADEQSVLLLSTDPELSARVLAESYPVEDSFRREYGVDPTAARDLFSAAMGWAERAAERVPGEEVVTAPCQRLLYHIGYVDGRSGRAAAWPAGPEAESSAGSAAAGVDAQDRVNEVLGPAYDRGWEYGASERLVAHTAPEFAAAVDLALEGFRARDDSFFFWLRGLRSAMVQGLAPAIAEATRKTKSPDPLAMFVAGRESALRQARARRMIESRVRRSGGRPHLAAARVLRVATRAYVREVRYPSEVRDLTKLRGLRDLRREAILVLAAAGLSPEAVAAIPLQRGRGLNRFVSEQPRVPEGAATVRTVLAGIQNPLPAANASPVRAPTPADYLALEATVGRSATALEGPARRLLATLAPSDLLQVRAEASLAAEAPLPASERAEEWVAAYRREAARLEVDAAVDRALLLARSRIVEGALDERAREIAAHIFDHHARPPEADTYLSPALDRFLGNLAGRALRAARKTVREWRADMPSFTVRVERWLQVRADEWVGQERVLGAAIQEAEAA